jgi:N-acetylglucosaminyldiphosphoundecaprenol N-acetyl-beta-D-mannosaminyltransferase
MNRGYASVDILGSHVHVLSQDEAVSAIEHFLVNSGGICRHVVVTGFHGLWEAYKDPDLRRILNSAELWVADGIAPVCIARLKGIRNMRRIPGAELMEVYFERAHHHGYRSFFYGDTEDTLTRLVAHLKCRYPGHSVCGAYSPPFRPLTPEEDDRVVRMINDAKPDVVWVGLGMPKQDRWIFEHKDRLDAPVVIGVGAAFRFHAGIIRRVPKAIGDMGLEWAWRLAMEPRKLWRRDMIDGPQFLFHVALELLGLKRYESGTDRDEIHTE